MYSNKILALPMRLFLLSISIYPVAVLHTGEIMIEMAPVEYVPYSVYFFLELVHNFEVFGTLHGMGDSHFL